METEFNSLEAKVAQFVSLCERLRVPNDEPDGVVGATQVSVAFRKDPLGVRVHGLLDDDVVPIARSAAPRYFFRPGRREVSAPARRKRNSRANGESTATFPRPTSVVTPRARRTRPTGSRRARGRVAGPSPRKQSGG